MSIDVFGRQITKGSIKSTVGARGPPGEGFQVTPDGQYDIHNRRLCHIGDAIELNDATTIKVVHSIVREGTHMLHQETKSLHENVNNTYEIINVLQSEFQNHKSTYRSDIDSLQNLSIRNADFIQQLDSKLFKLEKKCNEIQSSIQKI